MPTTPITIGELNDVPAPQSPINAQYMQEVANRIVHRFTTVAQMNAWAAGNGSLAFCAEVNAHYARLSGAWYELALIPDVNTVAVATAAAAQGILARATGVSGQIVSGNVETGVTNCSVAFNAVPNRWYRTTAEVPYAVTPSGTITPLVRLAFWDAGTNVIHEIGVQFPTPWTFSMSIGFIESGLSGVITRRLVATTYGSATLQLYDTVGGGRATNKVPWIAVEDCGEV